MTGATHAAFVVACYGAEGGIFVHDPDRGRGGIPRLALPNASFVARGRDPGVLHALSRDERGGLLTTLLLEEDGLVVLDQTSSGGAEPCHLALVAGGSRLVAANYADGQVGVFEVGDDARPRLVRTVRLEGRGPDPVRQDAAHPHFVLPVGDSDVLVVDLGSDAIWSVPLDDAGSGAVEYARLAPGSGPRHAVERGPFLVVSDELSGELASITTTDPRVQHVAPSSARVPVAGRSGPVYPGDVCRVPGGVAVANRGRDSIALFAVDDDGRLSLTAEHALPAGAWPQQLVADGAELLVVERDAGRISRMSVASGEVRPVVTGLGEPMWLLPLPPARR